jgi:uridine phosphorylase
MVRRADGSREVFRISCNGRVHNLLMASDPQPGTHPNDAPILEFDPTREAIVEAVHVTSVVGPDGVARQMPRRVVLCYFQDVIEKVVREHGARPLATLRSEIGPNDVYLLEREVPIALAHPGVGAPLAAGFLEELIGLGGRVFIAVGSAGALVPDLTLGHVIVPTAAIRDEGTSYHYLPASREVGPTQRVLDAILATLTERDVPFVTGKTWTTDAFFRETRGKVARRVAEGCICVEMEAAACFAVAQFRDVAFGQLLYAGDDLSGEIWDDRGWVGHATGREAIFRLAVDAITRLPA